jgi:acyl-CoA synthetase (AMP-forming)/AMP-acid ligase II
MKNLSRLLDENSARSPEKPALIYARGGQTWETLTYRQLLERSDQLAGGLTALGIQAGTRAVLMAPPSLDFFALAFALLRTGIVPVIVDPAIGFGNVRQCLADAKPQVYFGSHLTHAIRRIFGWGKATLQLNLTIRDVQRAAQRAIPFQPKEIAPESEAAIIYTSGSTGLPKGAVYTHANFASQIEMLTNAFHLSGDEIDLPAFPLFALIDCLVGATAVIPDMHFPAPAKIDPRRVIAAIHQYHVNTLFASPASLDRLARYGSQYPTQLDSLKQIITAGAPAPVSVLEQFWRLLPESAALFGVYGSTETLPISVVDSHEILSETRYLSDQGAGVCIGYPVTGALVRIIPIHDQPVAHWEDALTLPTGEIGEITVKGPAVTRSYVGQTEADRLAKIRDVDGEIIHRMGDLGYFDSQGRLWYCGRKSHRVVTDSGTLFTEPVEGIFNAHPQVYRTALVAIPVGVDLRVDPGRAHRHAPTMNEPVLWVQLKKDAREADRAKIRQELQTLGEKHPSARQIRHFLFHPAFPTDVRHNSKIIREKLARLAQKMVREQA